MYRDRILWARNEPSRIVVELIDGRGVNTMAATSEDLQILSESLYQFEITVGELPDGAFRRRKGRPQLPDPIAAELNADEAHHEDLLVLAVHADEFRTVRQFWNSVPCEFCGAIDLLYFRKPKDTCCCNNGKAAAYSSALTKQTYENYITNSSLQQKHLGAAGGL
jgi:hypothetical protein